MRPERLLQRVLRDQRFQLADQLAMLADREVQLDPRIERFDAQCLQPGDLSLESEWLDVLVRPPPPETERLAQQVAGDGLVNHGP